jgi:gliding motility-associated-like protein
MKKLYSTLILLIALSGISQVQASHISGGEILYECTGNPNEYLITVNLFRDCAGIAMDGTIPIAVNSSCGALPNLLGQLQNPGGTEISQLCAAQLPLSQCSGGTWPGMQVYVYTVLVTLSPQCDFYTFSWSTCCRNVTVNVPGSIGDGVYLDATLNNLDFPCNNSPVFNAQPIPYVCINQLINYSFGVSDAEGDSLIYSMMTGRENVGLNLLYGGGYTANVPISGLTLDPQTGFITFTATQVGNYIVVVKIDQYDRATGLLIGYVMRDIQVVVINCSNTPPDPSSGQIVSLIGTAVNPAPYVLEMCPLDSFCMTLMMTDPNPIDSLTLFSNLQSVLPGATMTTYNIGSPDTVYTDICWTAPLGASGLFNFIVVAQDDACPIASQQTYVYSISIPAVIGAGPDKVICGNEVASLDAFGSNFLTWTTLSGDTINPGNFSCNPCTNPTASPSQTTVYMVSSACQGTDTVVVTVAQDYTWTQSPIDTTICFNDSVTVDLDISIPGGFAADWVMLTNPPGGMVTLDDDSIPEPTFFDGTLGGNYTWQYTMVSDSGCVRMDTFSLNIVPSGIDVGPDVVLCGPDVGQIQGSAAGGTLDWTVVTGDPITGANFSCNPCLDPIADPAINTIYVATNGCGETDTISVVVASDYTWTQSPQDTTICFDDSLTINLDISPAGSYSIDWVLLTNPPGGTISMDSTDIATPTISNPSEGGTYTWQLTMVSDSGCIRVDTLSLNTVPSGIDVGPDVVLCGTDVAQIQATAAGGILDWTVVTGDPITGGNFSCNPCLDPIADPAISTIYVATNGCGETDTISVGVVSDYTWTQSPQDTTICFDDSLTINLDISPAGSYSIDWVLLTNPPGGTISMDSTDIATPTISNPSEGGTYTWQLTMVSDSGCVRMDTLSLNIIASSIGAGPDASVCGTQSTLLQGLSNGGDLDWSVFSGDPIILGTNFSCNPCDAPSASPTVTTEYIATNSCGETDTVIINVVPDFTWTVNYDHLSFCDIDTVLIDVDVTNGGNFTIDWTLLGGSVMQIDDGTITDPTLTNPANSGTYMWQFVIDNAGVCVHTDTVVFDIDIAVPLDLSATGGPGICPGDSVQLAAQLVTANNAVIYNWLPGVELTTTTGPNTTSTTPTSVTYQVIGLDATTGCADTAYVDVVVYPSVSLSFYATNPLGFKPHSTDFINTSDPTLVNWQWTFGDGIGISNLFEPSYYYTEAGVYQVSLTAENTFGCRNEAFGTVTVETPYELVIPNVFSPNGDGMNDLFEIVHSGVAVFHCEIFNRWGKKVHEYDNVAQHWSGENNADGTYYYLITTTSEQGDSFDYQGSFTLLH